jgi:hypothetical protein
MSLIKKNYVVLIQQSNKESFKYIVKGKSTPLSAINKALSFLGINKPKDRTLINVNKDDFFFYEIKDMKFTAIKTDFS